MSNTTQKRFNPSDFILRIFPRFVVGEITDKQLVDTCSAVGLTAAGESENIRNPNWGVGGRQVTAVRYTFDFYFEAKNIATCSVVLKKSTGEVTRLEMTMYSEPYQKPMPARVSDSSVVSALIGLSDNNK